MSKIRIGLIGAGGIARTAHFRALQRLSEEISVVAVADVAFESAKSLADSLGAKHSFKDYLDLLSLQDVDAVLVTVPNFMHAKVTNDALLAGKHVLCEKPMALNSEDAERMVSLQKSTGKTLMVALNNRFRRDTQLLKSYADAGELGDIYHGKCGWLRRAGIPGWGGWFTDVDKSGGGPLIDIGVHMLDLALYLMGNPKPISVVGSTYQKFGNSEGKESRLWGMANPNGVFNVEDMATAFIRLENDATLTLDVSWAANIEKDTFFVNLLGTKAGLSLENEKGVSIYTEKFGEHHDLRPLTSFNADDARAAMWSHFLNCVRTGETPIASPEHGLFLNQILDAIYKSSKTRKEVFI